MSERFLDLPQWMRFTLGRHVFKTITLINDLGSAALIALLVRNYLPPIPVFNLIAQIWFLAVVVFWLLTYEIDKNYRLDTFLTYTRVLKIACYAAIAYLVFFMISRDFYSLRFLFYSTLLWIMWATITRWLLNKFSSPINGLAFDKISSDLINNRRIVWQLNTDPAQVTLADFDFLMLDYNKEYSSKCRELLNHAHALGLPVLSAPQLIEHVTGKISLEHFNDFWVEATFYLNPFYLRFKRLFDMLITLLLSPLIIFLTLLIALLVLIFMGKPIFYWQERVGLNDKIFNMVKFRTMVINAEKLGAGYTEKNDTRVTRLGSILRKLRLDELPQFYNVLRGDMSIIGPRPEHEVLVGDFVKNIPLYQVRHWLRPGITGWAQVMHGYTTNKDETTEKLRYDMFYLKNVSLWLDLLIIFRTVITILTGFGSR